MSNQKPKPRDADLLFELFTAAAKGRDWDEIVYGLSMALAYEARIRDEPLDEVAARIHQLASQEQMMMNSPVNRKIYSKDDTQ